MRTTFLSEEGTTVVRIIQRLPLYESAPGFRNNTTGALNNVGNEGSVWSASASGTNGVYLRFVTNAVQPSNANNRANGFPVRCLQAFISVPCSHFYGLNNNGKKYDCSAA